MTARDADGAVAKAAGRVRGKPGSEVGRVHQEFGASAYFVLLRSLKMTGMKGYAGGLVVSATIVGISAY
jgi:hypothetical protein